MGMYFLSSVLMMRMSLPAIYRNIISNLLGSIEFNFYHRWFDVIFLVSGLASVVLLYFVHQANNSSVMFTATSAASVGTSPISPHSSASSGYSTIIPSPVTPISVSSDYSFTTPINNNPRTGEWDYATNNSFRGNRWSHGGGLHHRGGN